MADSLRDLLLKSGLVQKLKGEARPAAPAPKKPQPGKPQPGRAQPAKPKANAEFDLAQAYALRAREEKQARERSEREASERARAKKERKEKLLQLLRGKELNDPKADVPRHFPHRDKICRVYCTAEQLVRLNRGELGVAQLGGRYLLVDKETALAAQAIDPDALVLLCDPDAASDDDGIPPDLIW